MGLAAVGLFFRGSGTWHRHGFGVCSGRERGVGNRAVAAGVSRSRIWNCVRVPAALYDVQWLGALSPTDNFSAAQGINDFGQVVGNSYVQDANGIPTRRESVPVHPGGRHDDLGTAGATGAFAWDISNSGLVTGLVHEGGSLATGGLLGVGRRSGTTASATPSRAIGQPGMSSVAYGVNDSGVVVGNADAMTGRPGPKQRGVHLRR